MSRTALILALLAPLSAGADRTPLLRPEVEATLSWAAPSPESAPPMSLTASDGSGLRLLSVEADALISDPLAFTELRLTFENPEDRVREGRFEITLPPGAAISRFAMKIDDRWQEGEVLEKQRARQVYEDFLHRRQDPALLETDAGNQFRARVFPIPAGGIKELLISYSQELTGASEPWKLPLQGLPTLRQLDVTVSVDRWSSAPKVYTAHHKDFTPESDLALAMKEEQVDVGLRHGNLAIARVRPYLDLPPAKLDELTILVDTSASRMLGFPAQVERIEGVIAAIEAESGNIPVQVFAFDQGIESVYSGRIAGFDVAAEALLERDALGASDLSGALEALSEADIHDRLLLVTDGIFTAGPTEADALHATLLGLEVERLDVLVDGGIRDEAALSGLVTAGLPQAGLVLEADADPTDIAARLSEATRSGIAVSVPGAQWVWPTTLDGVQSGDDTLVYAWLPEDAPMQVQLTGASVEGPIRFADAPAPLLERAVMGANIARLSTMRSEATDPDEKRALQDEIIEMSVAHRVLSDFTALLVLETAADYERYGIARDGLTDILTISDHRIQVLSRDPWPMPEVVEIEVRPELKEEALKKRDESAMLRNLESGTIAVEEDRSRADTSSGEDFSANQSGPVSSDSAGAADLDMMEAPMEAPMMDPEPEPEPELRMMAQSEEESEHITMENIPTGRSYQSAVQMAPGVNGRSSAVDQAQGIISGTDQDSPEPPPREQPKPGNAWEGRFAEVMTLIEDGDTKGALAKIDHWRSGDPGDVLALLALGALHEADKDPEQAARAYGSIIDLFPSRADLRRMAGQRLEHLDAAAALAQDTYRVAAQQRPDHPSSHRLYAWSLVRAGKHEAAFEALTVGLSQEYPGRFPGVVEILREDLSIVGAAWIQAEPVVEKRVIAALSEHGTALPDGPTTRLILHWETDANDVDFHIYDKSGGHAWYSSKNLPSGGRLYADVTQGYGPECFTMSSPSAYPYTMQAHYYRRGPMGYGMGTLQVIEHDGHGTLAFDAHPFVIMKDDATVNLAILEAPMLKQTTRR
ncbi:MAG: tetratricopeptide (TPR) repeat protein [Myxococcota bacterium]|jgi:tetratricopeptide (TPR) repeat protein